jgi:hypothetical protein
VAAAAVRDSLRAGSDADRDCREVVIHASVERPSVEVVTADGRRGVRRLADPRDVEATVAALIVTVRDGPDPRDDAPGPTTVAAAIVKEASPAPPAGEPTPLGWRPQIVAGGGARVSLPGTQSVLLELSLGVARPGWELGLYGAWAPTAVAIGKGAQPTFTSSTEAAVGGAWRPALGSSGVDLIVGARAGLIHFVEGDHVNSTTNSDVSIDGVAPALTAWVGAAFATRSIVHFRPQVWYQWAAATRLGSSASDPLASSLSSIGLSVGVESRVP